MSVWKLICICFFPIAISIIFFSNAILNDNIILTAQNWDGTNIFLDIRMFVADQFSMGNFPFWYPYDFMGMPSFENIELSQTNPFAIIPYLLFDIISAFNIEVILTFILSFYCFYLWMRSHNIRIYISLFMSMVYAFSGSRIVLVNYGALSILQVSIWIPIIFYAIDKFTEKEGNKLYKTIFLSSLYLILFLAGHGEFSYFVLITSFVYGLLISKSKLNFVVNWSLALIVFLGLAAFQLLPLINYVINESARAVWQLDNNITMKEFSSPFGLLTSFVPGLWGHYIKYDVLNNNYIGMIPIALFFASIRKKNIAIYVLILFLGLFTFGKGNVLSANILLIIPFGHLFNNAYLFKYLYLALILLLSAKSLKSMNDFKVFRRSLLFLILTACVFWLYVTYLGLSVYDLDYHDSNIVPDNFKVGISLLIGCLCLMVTFIKNIQVGKYIVLIIASMEFIYFSSSFLLSSVAPDIEKKIFPKDTIFNYRVAYKFGHHGKAQNICGYHISPKALGIYNNKYRNVDYVTNLLKIMGVKYYVENECFYLPSTILKQRALQLVNLEEQIPGYRAFEKITFYDKWVYRNGDCFKFLTSSKEDIDRSVCLNNKTSMMPSAEKMQVKIDAFRIDSDTIRINLQTNKAGFLVINESYHPGWKSNNKELKLVRVNEMMMGIEIKSGGTYVLTLEYLPPYLKAGIVISLFMFIVLCALVLKQKKIVKIDRLYVP